MDLTGSLESTHLKIYPNKSLILFLKSLPDSEDIPSNILMLIGKNVKETDVKVNSIQLTVKDIENLNKIKGIFKSIAVAGNKESDKHTDNVENNVDKETESKTKENDEENKSEIDPKDAKQKSEKTPKPETPSKYLNTADIDWLYNYLNRKRSEGNVPYLHELLEGCNIEMPKNRVIKRNPVLEARCVKLRAQQEAREYRKMTKTVDNVRLRFPEDSISYQLKQVNRQLIAIGQFIISIFAGFLFGFRGIEWMVGNLDFGFRLLLGVMCALVIALAEIYFLAKKLNEELNIPETVQLGGPPKFANEPQHMRPMATEKEHQD